MTEEMPLLNYLANLVPIPIDEDALKSILFDRDLSADLAIGEVELRLRELCRADVYMWCAMLPNVTGSVSDSDGDWSHREGGMRISDALRLSLRQRANELYRKYGEEYRASRSSIRFRSGGLRQW